MLRCDGHHVQTTSMRLWTFNSSYTYDEDEKEDYGDDEEVDEDDEDGNGRIQFLYPLAKDTLGGVVESELGWGLILYGEEEEDYLATTNGNRLGPRLWKKTK